MDTYQSANTFLLQSVKKFLCTVTSSVFNLKYQVVKVSLDGSLGPDSKSRQKEDVFLSPLSLSAKGSNLITAGRV